MLESITHEIVMPTFVQMELLVVFSLVDKQVNIKSFHCLSWSIKLPDLAFILNYEYIEQDNYQKNSGFRGRVQSVQALLAGNVERWVGFFFVWVFVATHATITNTG